MLSFKRDKERFKQVMQCKLPPFDGWDTQETLKWSGDQNYRL